MIIDGYRLATADRNITAWVSQPSVRLMTTMRVSIPDHLKISVDSRVNNGNHGSTSEYVRDLIRRDHDRRLLRTALLEGARSAVVGTADAAYFAALRDQ